MVSLSKLLEVTSRLVRSSPINFTSQHANTILRFVGRIPVSIRSREDRINMATIVINCPHASTLFAHDAKLCDTTLTAFLVERTSFFDSENDELLRQIIRCVSINESLPSNILLTMARILGRNSSTVPYNNNNNNNNNNLNSSYLPNSNLQWDDTHTDEILLRVATRIPKPGEPLSDGGLSSSIISQKYLHKRRHITFEKPELLFMLSTLRQISQSRLERLRESEKASINNNNNNKIDKSYIKLLPDRVVDDVLQCVKLLPAFVQDEAPLRIDDWAILVNLIGSNDTRLHSIGNTLWKKKSNYYNPVKEKDFIEDEYLINLIGTCLRGLRGESKIEAIKVWIDILTNSKILLEMKDKNLFLLLVDISICVQICEDFKFREYLISSGSKVLEILSKLTPFEGLNLRVSFTKSFPFLQKSKEVDKTINLINKALSSDEEINRDVFRDIAEYLRYVQKHGNINFNNNNNNNNIILFIKVSKLLAQRVFKFLDLPSLDQEHISAIIPAIVTFTSLSRHILFSCNISEVSQEEQKEETLIFLEKKNELFELFEKLAAEFLQRHSTHADPFLTAVLLQLMEILDFASKPKYSTPVREYILSALHSIPGNTNTSNKTQQQNNNNNNNNNNKTIKITTSPHNAQHCYDLILRAIRFHVADAEIFVAANKALRQATDTNILRNMNWELRVVLLDRIAAVYREISQFFATSREARKLAKQMLIVSAVIASDQKMILSLSHSLNNNNNELNNKSYDLHEKQNIRRSAQHMWVIALRTTLMPIPRTPVDRHVNLLLKFASKHWIFEVKDKNNSTINEECSREILNILLALCHILVVSAFKNKTLFYANVRRSKFIISTACEILLLNKDLLSPCVWFYAQRMLANLPAILPGQCTPLQIQVLKISLENTLYNVKECNNRGKWHMLENRIISTLEEEEGKEKENNNNNKIENEIILTPKILGDMFSCADLIDNVELRGYLIILVSEQISMMNSTTFDTEKSSFSIEEKARMICLHKVLSTLRRGSVLYY